ncbi:MAG: hypothetical protein O2U62_00525 [Candidatus Bathyarchaeota archaeon]|nr:hypothetical protein [Candidatus Bathyarchaeota archaeon]
MGGGRDRLLRRLEPTPKSNPPPRKEMIGLFIATFCIGFCFGATYTLAISRYVERKHKDK